MADGTVELSSEGVGPTVDTELMSGTTTHRQRIIIAGGSSASFAFPLTTVPSTSTYALPIRIVGPTTGIYLGASTELTGRISSGSQTIGTVIMSSGLGASTAIIGSLSSGTAQIGILGPSSGNVIGTVVQSSNWNISTGAIVSLSSALTNYVTNSTTVPVYLGASTSNIVGIVGLSSAVALSSGSLYLGVVVSATSGTVNLSTTSVVGLTTTATVGLTTTALAVLSSGTAYVGTVVSASSGLVYFSTTTSVGIKGVVAGSTFPAAVTSGAMQDMMVDTYGRQIVGVHAPPNMLLTASVVTANTSGATLIAAPGAGLRTALVMVTAYTTSVGASIVYLQSSSGQAAPGAWSMAVPLGPAAASQILDFTPPLFQPTANNGWFVVSTSSAVAVRVHAQYFTLSTA